MFCGKCGNPLGNNAYCPRCGAQAPQPTATYSQPDGQPYEQPYSQSNGQQYGQPYGQPDGQSYGQYNANPYGGTVGAGYAQAEELNVWTAWIGMFKKYAQFDGRSRRKEFWYAWVANYLVNFFGGIFAGVFEGTGLDFVIYVVLMIYGLVALVPSLALAVRRLHDSNHSGWYLLMALIPFVGPILVLVAYCSDSSYGFNQYGPNPKGL